MAKGLWRSIDGGKNWEMVHRVTDYWETITKVYFLDTKFGWMETHNGWFKSEDGGQTWTPFETPLSSSGSFRDVKFISRDTGWIGGAALRVPSPKELKLGVPRHLLDDITGKVLTPIIYRTDDGGKTWRVQNIPANLGDVKDIDFIDSDHGIALDGPEAFHTRDGGKTWLKVNDPQTCDGNGEEGGYEGKPYWAYLFDSSSQWLAFDDGRILRTTDGWRTSVELQPCDQNRPTVLHFSSQNRGHGLGSDKFLYETSDGGKQWIRVGTDKYDSLSFLDNQGAWLVSERGLFRLNIGG
ncbi:MAG TPA: hypothetical protein VEM96_12090 [Pyrinomonadaceae bacterium]|nr:hypothetical protein [Pyrinomonadaceae bacterium]